MGITTTTTGRVVASWPAASSVQAPGGAATFEAVHESLLRWFDSNLRLAEGFGYEINGNEIYWFTLDGIPSWTVAACTPAAVTFGVAQGNEGWQVRGFCRGKGTASGSVHYWPVLTAKVWTLGAACQLVAALTEATADLFEITPAAA
jgi:hypothetical protein